MIKKWVGLSCKSKKSSILSVKPFSMQRPSEKGDSEYMSVSFNLWGNLEEKILAAQQLLLRDITPATPAQSLQASSGGGSLIQTH